MTDLERYVIEEHVEDFKDGFISRRELLRRVTLITGSTAATLSILALVGCNLNQPQQAATSPPAASGNVSAGYATPPPSGTTTGITVRPDDPRIKVEAITIKASDGAGLVAYLARPASGGRSPGILIAHENRGLVEHIRDVVRRVATAGFVGTSLDLLSRQGGAERLSDPGAYAAELGKHSAADMVSDLRAGLDYLKAHSSVAGDRIGTTGFCFGGGMVWNVLASGIEVKAAVPFYGPAPSNVDGLAKTRAAVFAVYAEQDTRITNTAPNIEAKLKQSGRPYQVKVYPGVNHAFHNDTGPRYAPDQAQQAWVATIEWFRKYLT